MFGYIYITTNLINNKTYVGKKYGDFNKNYYGSGLALQHAIKKYGKENFVVKVLSWHDNEVLLNEAEVAAIATMNPAYNIAKGGTGGNTLALANNERKEEVIGKRKTGVRNAWKNASPEKRKIWGENIRQAKKGIATLPADYRHSEEVKERISESNKKSSKNRPESWYKSHAENAKRRQGKPSPRHFKKVKVNEVIYNSVKEAYTTLGISDCTFYRWVKQGKIVYVK
jgi:group I intron endonuclease